MYTDEPKKKNDSIVQNDAVMHRCIDVRDEILYER